MKKVILSVAALMLSLSVVAAQADTTITVKGSTTVQPAMQKVAEAYMKAKPGVNISISASGSGDGAKALIDKSTDIAMMSRDIKESEVKQATEKGVAPKLTVIAYDCIVPIVNPVNKVQDLTMDQLKGIFTGKITDWKDVGGEPGKIVVVSRDSSSGTYEFWGEHVLKGERVFAGALLQASNGAIVQTVAKNKYAIGYVGLAYAQNKEVKDVKVAGVMGTAENVLNKSYAVSRTLNLYTDGEPKGEPGEFIKFFLGPDGQKLVGEADFVPVKK